MALLEIKDLHAQVGDREILKGIGLSINSGEVHAIMGPNGSGKSTLAQVLAGRELYHVTGGQVIYDGKDLLEMSPEDRARSGIFLAFQYPVEIPGVSNMYFLKAALNTTRKAHGLEELDALDFLNLVREKMKLMDMDQALLNRPVNTGFSGGEKKRNEIFQMAVLEPRLAILDETDSGLDIDALRVVAGGVNALRSPERGMIVVTHYQRLLNYIVPDFVHVLSQGRIVKSGGRNWRCSSKRAATPAWASKRTKRRSRAYDGSGGTDRSVAGGVYAASRGRAVGERAARAGVRPIRRARISDYAQRRVALHQYRADCPHHVSVQACRLLGSASQAGREAHPGRSAQASGPLCRIRPECLRGFEHRPMAGRDCTPCPAGSRSRAAHRDHLRASRRGPRDSSANPDSRRRQRAVHHRRDL